MRTRSSIAAFNRIWPRYDYRLTPQSDEDGRQPKVAANGQKQAAHDDLPYKVELWDTDKKVVEQVLAVTANGSIGYAAYYAAAREHPDRYVTLRHKKSIIARMNGPGQ